jgi:hypothetical protein
MSLLAAEASTQRVMAPLPVPQFALDNPLSQQPPGHRRRLVAPQHSQDHASRADRARSFSLTAAFSSASAALGAPRLSYGRSQREVR